MVKRLVSTVLSFLLIMGVFFVAPAATNANAHTLQGAVALTKTQSGTCGENLKWKLDRKGLLTVTGSGDMYDYDSEYTPWGVFNEEILKVVISDGVKSIGNSAFFDCPSLAEVSISDSVTSIGDSAFSACGALSSLVIGNSVNAIGDSAFKHCSALTEISIPASVEEIGDSAFLGCKALSNLTVSEDNKNYSCADGILFDKSHTELIYCVASKAGALRIEDKITSIHASAFESCDKLTSVILPHTLKTIGDSAFRWCTSLKNVIIPNSVTTIGKDAFQYSSKAVICGYKDSYAQKYAEANSVKFESLVSTEDEKTVAFYITGETIDATELVLEPVSDAPVNETTQGADFYDISVNNNDKSVFLLAPMIICMPVMEDIEPMPGAVVDYEVYRISASGKAKPMQSSVEGSCIVFTATSEGCYAVKPVYRFEDGRVRNVIVNRSLLGDINGSGAVTMEDVVMLQQEIAGLVDFTNEQTKLGDVDRSGDITMVDVTTIQQYIAELIEKF